MAFSMTQIATGTLTDSVTQVSGGKSSPTDTETQIQGTGFGDALIEVAKSDLAKAPSNSTLRLKTPDQLPSAPQSTSDHFVWNMPGPPAPSLESQPTVSKASVRQIAHLKALIPQNESEKFGSKTEAAGGSVILDKNKTNSTDTATDSETQAVTFKGFELVSVSGDQKPPYESAEIDITSWGPHALSDNAALIPISADFRDGPKLIMQIPTEADVASEPSSVPLDIQKQHSGPPPETRPKVSKSAPFFQIRNSNATVTSTSPIMSLDDQSTENSRASAIELDAHQMPQHDGSVTWEQVRANTSIPTSGGDHGFQPFKKESVPVQNQPATPLLQEQHQQFDLVPAAHEDRSEIGRELSKRVNSVDPSPMTPMTPKSEVVITRTLAGSEKTPATPPSPPEALNPFEDIEQLRMSPQHESEVIGSAAALFTANSPTLISAISSMPAHPPTQLPQHISMQICGALEASGNQDIEIRLDPEELGRVRIVLSTKEGGMNVTVFSDRPEVLDLMRRNSDMLEADFSDIGYESANFSFQQEHDDKPNPDQDVIEHWDIEQSVDLPTSQQHTTRDNTRLDLKI